MTHAAARARNLASRFAPPLLLMAVIYSLGTDAASFAATRSQVERLLAAWLPVFYAHLAADDLWLLNFSLRKASHFFGYALLGFLDARALAAGRPRLETRPAGLAWIWAAAWAGVDEYHQGRAGTRGSSPEDVALDAAGAGLGLLLYDEGCRRWTARRRA